MIYFIVVHKDPDSSFGVTIPDIPGCFTAGDSIDEVIKNVQEAVECHLHDAKAVPKPTHDIKKLMSDTLYEGGMWIAVDVDMSFIFGKTVEQPKKLKNLKRRKLIIGDPDELADLKAG